MLPLVAAWLLHWQDPADLARDLASESVEVREAAAAALYRRGDEIRGLLIDTREAAPDLEARSRAREILRRLDADDRIRDFGGGPRVAGFGASLHSDRFFGAGPFRLTLEIMNLGPGDRELPSIASWEMDLPDQEVRVPGAQARVSVKKFIASPGFRRTTWKTGEGGSGPSRLLRPGESARVELTLEARAVPPGDYDVSVEYFARDLLPGAEENLRTNAVRLMVR